MTFKPTTAILNELERDKKLVPFEPRLVGQEKVTRRIYVTESVSSWLSSTKGQALVKAAARSVMGEFIKGEKIDDLDFVKRVENRRVSVNKFADEIWSLRSKFDPQRRFFGTFALPDNLVIFSHAARGDLRTDQSWHKHLDKCVRTWNALFPGVKRLFGDNFQSYVTFNSEHLDDRW